MKRFIKETRTKNGGFTTIIEIAEVDARQLPWDKPITAPGTIWGLSVYGASAPHVDISEKRTYPSQLITRFEVRFNGKPVPFAEKYKKYIFSAPIDDAVIFQNNGRGNFLALLGRDDDSLMILMWGGDGIGTYGIGWHINKNGVQGFFEQEHV